MLSTTRKIAMKRPNPTALSLLRSFATQPTLARRCAVHVPPPSLLRMATTRPCYALASRLPMAFLQQQRALSFWNIPVALMTASPLKRRIALVAMGGVGLAVTIVLGPFLLLGIGGLAAVMGLRLWRFKRQLMQQSGAQDWPDFMHAFLLQQQQGSGLFGQDQQQVQKEVLRRLDAWAQSDRGRYQLIEYGLHPDRILQDVSMRGSSYASIMTSSSNSATEIKIELDLGTSPGAVLIAVAQLDKESNDMLIKSIRLVTETGHSLTVPLDVLHQNHSGGRVIEGEFRDV
jgi:hypothetical protein